MELTEQNLNRLAIAVMEKFDVDYDSAVAYLSRLRLHFHVDNSVGNSYALQSALITAINCGKRAFAGGVTVTMPDNIPLLLTWPRCKTLNQVVINLGGTSVVKKTNEHFELCFGTRADSSGRSLEILCNSWQGGINPSLTGINLPEDDFNLPFGGVVAASLGVGLAFMTITQIDISCADKVTGISVWRPDLNWLSTEAVGKAVTEFPKKIWALGMGHLGQAYLWTLGLIPFSNTSAVKLTLQDYDRVATANWSAGLLCEPDKVNLKKTRICAEWLEDRKFETDIIEHPFDEHTQIHEKNDDPYVAICGFDSAAARRSLQYPGFDLIVEAGIGGGLNSFDDITMHSFIEGSRKPEEIWQTEGSEKHHVAQKQFENKMPAGCGVLAEVLASKSISSAFVGAFASAFIIAELAKASMCEKRIDQFNLSLRRLRNRKIFDGEVYTDEVAKNGTISVSIESIVQEHQYK